MGVCWGVACGCTGAHCGAAQGRSSGELRRGAARSSPGEQRGAAQGRSLGLRRGAASGGAVVGGCAGAQHGPAYGRGAELRRGAAVSGFAWAQFEAAQGRSSVGLRKGVVCGCVGV